MTKSDRDARELAENCFSITIYLESNTIMNEHF